MEYNELVNAVVSDVVKEAVEAPMKEADNPTKVKTDGHTYHFDSIPKGQEGKVKEILHRQNHAFANLSDGEKANIAAQHKKALDGYAKGAKADKEYYAKGGK